MESAIVSVADDVTYKSELTPHQFKRIFYSNAANWCGGKFAQSKKQFGADSVTATKVAVTEVLIKRLSSHFPTRNKLTG